MFIEILLVVAIVFQIVAAIYASRLVSVTKYNAIWWLFIISFILLIVERVLQLVMIDGARTIPFDIFWWTGLVVSIGLSIGVMYAHRLFKYIDRLIQQRQFVSRRILSAVIRTEEKSLSKFSKELHDGLGPLLSSAKMSLSSIPADKLTDKQRETLSDTNYLIDEAIRSLREISNNLSPQVLNDFGLVKGMQNFINKSRSISKIDIDFKTNMGTERYDKDTEVILYRVLCELVNNSLKHSSCTKIEVELHRSTDKLHLYYHDNGCGFVIRPVEDRGMGLSNITSRTSSINGLINITSTLGEGMSAIIQIPLT